jgi:hypothetical protein
MSLGRLFVDTITWRQPGGAPTDTDASGAPIYDFQDAVLADPCRVDAATAEQKLAWGMDVMEVGWTVYTRQSGIRNGWVGLLADGRVLRVRGVNEHRAIGTLPTFYSVICSELRTGADA